MKRLFLAFLALLLCVGVASATNIPPATDAVNNKEVWITPVYNNESAEIGVGQVVQWDMDSSTGDNKNYVVLCELADTFLVAGVVYPSAIAAKSIGFIATKGPIQVDVQDTVAGVGNGTMLANQLICTSQFDGYGQVCSAPDGDANAFGYATAAGSTSSVIVNVFAK